MPEQLAAFDSATRAATIVDLFQNALVYTTVLRNIDVRARNCVALMCPCYLLLF